MRKLICPECKAKLSDFWVQKDEAVQTKYYCKECDKSFFPSEVKEEKDNESNES